MVNAPMPSRFPARTTNVSAVRRAGNFRRRGAEPAQAVAAGRKRGIEHVLQFATDGVKGRQSFAAGRALCCALHGRRSSLCWAGRRREDLDSPF